MADLQVSVLLVRPATVHGVRFELADSFKRGVESSARVGPIISPLPELRGQVLRGHVVGHLPLAQVLVIVGEVANTVILAGGRRSGLGHVVPHVSVVRLRVLAPRGATVERDLVHYRGD